MVKASRGDLRAARGHCQICRETEQNSQNLRIGGIAHHSL
jgi:hypothetical protein